MIKPSQMRRFPLVAAYVLYGCVICVMAGLVYHNTFHRELAALKETGAVRLSEAASRLRLQIDGYRSLANIVARDQTIRTVRDYDALGDVSAQLEAFEVTYGAWRIDLTTPAGALLATSGSPNSNPQYPRPLLQAAMNNRLGFAQAFEDGERIIRLSRGVMGDTAQPRAIIVVSVSLASLEFEWPVAPEPIVFFDAAELSFSSNRLGLLYLSRGGDPEQAPFDLAQIGTVKDIDLWRFKPPGEPVDEIIKVEQYVPHLELTGAIFLSTSDARSSARLLAVLLLTSAVVLGLIGAVAVQQIRRRILEEQYSAELESRVAERTQELRDAQDALVEASKLAALGRLSAGISHEVNQPLSAILNFARNGQKLLARGRDEDAAQNLTLIADQVQRITRIIGNLRAFARQEAAPTTLIDFGAVLSSAMDLTRDDIEQAGVSVSVARPDQPVVVLAGQVRLEQVVINLISNALDAMAQAQEKRLALTLRSGGAQAVLTVTDTGHGIAEPSSVFEPFYTTKDLGASKGLGLGLALSHGIITRFGGTLACRNLTIGSEFTLGLPIAEENDA